MTVDGVITLVVLGAMLVALVRELVAPITGVIGALIVLLLAGVIGPAEAFAGFSNPATVTVAALLVIGRAVQDTGGIDLLLGRVLGRASSDRGVLARMVPTVSAASSVIANTPIVAMLASPLRAWAERHGRPPSRYLMPLSFGAILGGVITTIGTSVTLLVSGLVDEAGFGQFGILEVTPVGVPVAVVGGAALVLLAPRLLPDRRGPLEQVSSAERDYTFAMRVRPDGPLAGRSVRDAELRNLAGVYLARIEREEREIAPVAPDETLVADDLLTFVGNVDVVRDLRGIPGLESAEETHVAHLDGQAHGLVEAVIGAGSPLVGRTPKEASFRGRYGAAIVAVHRAGRRIERKIGDVHLEAGDALLLLADGDFAERWRGRHDFLVIVPLEETRPATGWRTWLVLLVLAGMVVVAAIGIVSLLQATLGAVLVLIATRAVRVNRARDALDLDVLLIIAGAIGLGGAVEASGLAALAADRVESVAVALGAVGALAAVLLGTLALTEMVTNAAAAALMVPVALETASRTGSDPHALAVVVAIGASASFLTPIGYQTNTMVYGLGGYRFGDYWRLGLPLTLVVIATTLVVVPLVWRI